MGSCTVWDSASLKLGPNLKLSEPRALNLVLRNRGQITDGIRSEKGQTS